MKIRRATSMDADPPARHRAVVWFEVGGWSLEHPSEPARGLYTALGFQPAGEMMFQELTALAEGRPLGTFERPEGLLPKGGGAD